LKAHKLMTQGLVTESGEFRSGNVGVFDGDVAVHIGARPQFVPQLMKDLFDWAKGSDLHPVLKSAILHYEIETIHPFADGNGRMGRLWQTLLLTKWNAIFAWIPMESVLYQNRRSITVPLRMHGKPTTPARLSNLRFPHFTKFCKIRTLTCALPSKSPSKITSKSVVKNSFWLFALNQKRAKKFRSLSESLTANISEQKF